MNWFHLKRTRGQKTHCFTCTADGLLQHHHAMWQATSSHLTRIPTKTVWVGGICGCSTNFYLIQSTIDHIWNMRKPNHINSIYWLKAASKLHESFTVNATQDSFLLEYIHLLSLYISGVVAKSADWIDLLEIRSKSLHTTAFTKQVNLRWYIFTSEAASVSLLHPWVQVQLLKLIVSRGQHPRLTAHHGWNFLLKKRWQNTCETDTTKY